MLHFRTKFEDYEIPTLNLPVSVSGRNSPAKVHRCKTCRKVFNKVSALAAHRKTHTAGFDTSRRGGFNVSDFARRFSDFGTSKGDPNTLKPSEYEALLTKISPHPSTICSPCLIRNLDKSCSSFTAWISDNITFRFCLNENDFKFIQKSIFQNFT